MTQVTATGQPRATTRDPLGWSELHQSYNTVLAGPPPPPESPPNTHHASCLKANATFIPSLPETQGPRDTPRLLHAQYSTHVQHATHAMQPTYTLTTYGAVTRNMHQHNVTNT